MSLLNQSNKKGKKQSSKKKNLVANKTGKLNVKNKSANFASKQSVTGSQRGG
ncbi:MAG: hypothetical protein KDC06_04055 [Chitinophagaceae bacterium]|nr:hypothetical protein [Chitinophagaceae bacterium]